MEKLGTWEKLLKRILWQQIGELKDKRILDFGSGYGVTANHYAQGNDLIAIEPSEADASERRTENFYEQIIGSTDELHKLSDASFDVIFCHNVLEYAGDREEIIREFYRLLKPGGMLSLVKHNRPGRVMQMVVLLNEFDRAHNMLNGKSDAASKYGAIHHYEDTDLLKWCEEFKIKKVFGIRTFWDLQQNQEIQETEEWQDKIVEIELKVSELEPYRSIAFFHHLLLEKEAL